MKRFKKERKIEEEKGKREGTEAETQGEKRRNGKKLKRAKKGGDERIDNVSKIRNSITLKKFINNRL